MEEQEPSGETCDVYVPGDMQEEDAIADSVGPPVDDEHFRDRLIDGLADYMMVNRGGFSPTKDDYPVEWDRTVEDSQISFIIDDIEMILDYLEEVYGYNFSIEKQQSN